MYMNVDNDNDIYATFSSSKSDLFMTYLNTHMVLSEHAYGKTHNFR